MVLATNVGFVSAVERFNPLPEINCWRRPAIAFCTGRMCLFCLDLISPNLYAFPQPCLGGLLGATVPIAQSVLLRTGDTHAITDHTTACSNKQYIMNIIHMPFIFTSIHSIAMMQSPTASAGAQDQDWKARIRSRASTFDFSSFRLIRAIKTTRSRPGRWWW